MNELASELTQSFRSLRRTPGLTAVAVLALALGIGANGAIFSIVNAVLIRPLPVTDPDRLVMVWEANQKLGFPQVPSSGPNFFDWREQNQVFVEMAAAMVLPEFGMNVVVNGEPERAQAGFASSGLFSTLDVRPVIGRQFVAGEDRPGGEPVALISEGLWRRRFGADPSVIGRMLLVDGTERTIIGVTPSVLDMFGSVEIWVPLALDPNGPRDNHSIGVIARLKDGVTIQQAQADMGTIAARLAQAYPASNDGWDVQVVPLASMLTGGLGPALLLLLGAVGLLLLIGCANVANLLLAKVTARSHEVALRAALGATRARIVRQLLVESSLLGLIGGAVGVLLAALSAEVLRSALPDIFRFKEISVDWRVLLFTLVVSILTGLLLGLLPALRMSKVPLAQTLKAGGARGALDNSSQRARKLLLVFEIALASILAVCSGLMLKSFVTLLAVDPGLRTDNMLTMRVNLPAAKYKDPAERRVFFERLLPRVQASPGVDSATAVSILPLRGKLFNLRIMVWPFRVEGRPAPKPGEEPTADVRTITPGYFQTVGIPMVNGRSLEDRDASDSPPVVVVNETLVRRHFPSEDPVGKMLRVGGEPRQIVGVVADSHLYGLADATEPALYLPHAQYPSEVMSLIVHSPVGPSSLSTAIRAEVLDLDPAQPISDIRTLEEVLADSLMVQRLSTWLIGIFASLAVVLATVGVYGLTAFLVARRTREFGLRMALGARRRQVFGMVITSGIWLALAGVTLGMAGAFALSRVLAGLLFGVTPHDPVTFATIPLLLIGVAAAASFNPARRATRVDPVIALRYE